MAFGEKMGFWKKAACVAAAGISAFGIGYIAKSIWPEQIEYGLNKYSKFVVESDEKLEKMPGLSYAKRMSDWVVVNVYGMADSKEDLDKKREQIKSDLDSKINEYEQRGN